MKGKRVLVTGASSGIGFQIAKDLLKKGALVGGHYRQNLNGAKMLFEHAGPDQCRLFQADFADSLAIHRLWKGYTEWSQGIDILINCAAEASDPVPLNELTEDAWDRTFQVNVKAPWLISRAALDLMSKQGSGRIVNISSVGIKFGGGISTVHYSASKSALEALTMSFAKAGAPYNVLVNAVRPGVTDTGLHAKLGRGDLSERIDLVPLKRLAEPKEIANAVLFLASEQSTYITGTILTVAGGE